MSRIIIRSFHQFQRQFSKEIINKPKERYITTNIVLCHSNQNIGEKCNSLTNFPKKLINKLEELFKVHPYILLDTLDKHKKIKEVSLDLITENYNLCKCYDVSDSVILNHADILTQRNIEFKLKLLRELPFKTDTTIVLVNLRKDILTKLIQRIQAESSIIVGGRIQFLANLFKTTPQFICESLVKKPFLQSKNLDKIASDCKLLLKYGVELEEINKDLWVFMYSTEHLQERLDFAKENNVEQIKTWMMRATPEIFEIYLRRRSDNKSVLGDNSLVEYLSNRLECTPEFAKYMISKQPAIKNKSMKKMQEIIEFLLQQGFKPLHICRVPKILLHSVETMRKRINELGAQGVQMDSLHILTKSQKQYQQYYESLLKVNKMRNKHDST